MSESTLMERLSRFFRRSQHDTLIDPDAHSSAITPVEASRTSFLRPWAKRDQAIADVRNGVNALSDLMHTIRENLERQGERQDQLLQYLSHLPQALESLPEANRMQAETLRAIHQQLAQANGQQNKLGEILEQIVRSSSEQRQTMEDLRERVEDLNLQDQRMTEALGNVGAAMRSVSDNSATSAQVLQQVRDNINHRDGQLERILLKQNTRFTTMLAIAILLSVCALAAVCVMGYLLWMRGAQ